MYPNAFTCEKIFFKFTKIDKANFSFLFEGADAITNFRIISDIKLTERPKITVNNVVLLQEQCKESLHEMITLLLI